MRNAKYRYVLVAIHRKIQSSTNTTVIGGERRQCQQCSLLYIFNISVKIAVRPSARLPLQPVSNAPSL